MISFCIPTSRTSYGAYVDFNSEVHLFEPFVNSLYHQLDEEVELVIADRLFETRDLETFFKPYPKIKLKVVPQESPWLRMGLNAYSSSFNQAAKAATGDYLVILSDALSFPPHFWKKIQEKRAQQIVAQILFVNKRDYSLETLDPTLVQTEWFPNMLADADNPAVIDARWKLLPWDSNGLVYTFQEIPWQQCFGFFGIPKDTFYRMNGFDENFDGQKELNDVEFFSRLQMLDSRSPVEFDQSLYVYHHRHFDLVDLDEEPYHCNITVRSNYDMIHLHRAHGITIGNSECFPKKTLMRVVRSEITGHPHSLKEGERRVQDGQYLIDYWIQNQPIFDL